MGQAYFNANNDGTGVFVQVSDPSISGGASIDVGAPATTAGFAGVGKGQVTIDMFVAAAGTSLAALEASTPVAIVHNSTSGLTSFQGTFAPGNPFALPTLPGIFDGSAPIEVIFYGSGGNYAGFSSEGILTPSAAGSGNVAPAIFGSGAGQIKTFNLTPVQTVVNPVPDQTSTVALSGLSAVALVFFGRRNK